MSDHSKKLSALHKELSKYPQDYIVNVGFQGDGPIRDKDPKGCSQCKMSFVEFAVHRNGKFYCKWCHGKNLLVKCAPILRSVYEKKLYG